jgi:hypothetical protein
VSPAEFAFTPTVILGMAGLALFCTALCVILIGRTMTQEECDCPPPRILRNQRGGYTWKTFHADPCRFRNS